MVREKVLGDDITDDSPDHMVQIKSIFKLLDAGTQPGPCEVACDSAPCGLDPTCGLDPVSFDESLLLTNALHDVLRRHCESNTALPEPACSAAHR